MGNYGGGPPPGYDDIMAKLTAGGCPRKDVGDYVIFLCKGSKAVFAFSAPGSAVHPALLVGRIEPGMPTVLVVMGRPFTKPGDIRRVGDPPSQQDLAFPKWERGLGYLKVDDLR